MQSLQSNPPEGIKVMLNEADVLDIQAIIQGPSGTPYAKGAFKVKLSLPKDFPASPPKAYFLTKVSKFIYFCKFSFLTIFFTDFPSKRVTEWGNLC